MTGETNTIAMIELLPGSSPDIYSIKQVILKEKLTAQAPTSLAKLKKMINRFGYLKNTSISAKTFPYPVEPPQ